MIALVSCSASKRPGTHPARQLYSTSPLFVKSLAYASTREDITHTYIVSALHGVVTLDTELASYNRSITDMAPHQRLVWGRDVCLHLQGRGHAAPDLVILAGAPYVDAIVGACTRLNIARIETPLSGMQIGQRLSWLNRETSRLSDLRARRGPHAS